MCYFISIWFVNYGERIYNLFIKLVIVMQNMLEFNFIKIYCRRRESERCLFWVYTYRNFARWNETVIKTDRVDTNLGLLRT